MNIDATDAIVGRLSAKVAKTLLEGESVVIVNAERAVFSGNPVKVVRVYARRREMTDKADPSLAAKWPRRPDLFLRRIIRGMLPKRHYRQTKALGLLRIHMGVPDGVDGAKPFSDTAAQLSGSTISVRDVCAHLGWKNPLEAKVSVK
ncbi:MAG: 50S ribosomal protein L13 [Candidatus Micrarchaeota archaeon]|nr:50S ribosomal protein L13 [Candidatus Micrarchaeota archaeon]